MQTPAALSACFVLLGGLSGGCAPTPQPVSEGDALASGDSAGGDTEISSPGDTLNGDVHAGDTASGDPLSGDALMGDEPMGDARPGDTSAGDAAGPVFDVPPSASTFVFQSPTLSITLTYPSVTVGGDVSIAQFPCSPNVTTHYTTNGVDSCYTVQSDALAGAAETVELCLRFPNYGGGLIRASGDTDISGCPDALGASCAVNYNIDLGDSTRCFAESWTSISVETTEVAYCTQLQPPIDLQLRPFEDRTDPDFDGSRVGCDNCPDDFNPGQVDSNANDLGDVCDPCTPNPCTSAPADFCTVDVASVHNDPGICTAVGTNPSCDYGPTIIDCATTGEVCVGGSCN